MVKITYVTTFLIADTILKIIILLFRSYSLFSIFNQQLIMLSASANKLSKLKEQAEGYAALIMEELDPENLGYIEVRVGK